MSKIVTIHQPEHLPWMGFFNKVAKADEFVILDSVPFEKNYFQNRNRICGTNGMQWLGIPVTSKGHLHGTIAQTPIAKDLRWQTKYLRTIRDAYGKHPYFNDIYDSLENIILSKDCYIADMNISIIKLFLDGFRIKTTLIRSSDYDFCGKKSDLILDICKKRNATTYLSGPFGREYLDHKSFDTADIKVGFNDYNHPSYPQRKTSGFLSYLSALDLVMNVGYEEGYHLIMQGNEGISYDWNH